MCPDMWTATGNVGILAQVDVVTYYKLHRRGWHIIDEVEVLLSDPQVGGIVLV